MNLKQSYLSAFLLCTLFFVQCEDDPDYSIEPYIEMRGVNFIEVAGISNPDTLKIRFFFRDGDMDIGLRSNDDEDPYHPYNFFLEQNTELIPVGTARRYAGLGQFIKLSPGQEGKLATVRTRKKAGFEYLPPFQHPFTCTNYLYDSAYISEEDKNIIDNTYNIYDTLTAAGLPNVYIVLDTFYIQWNPNFFNLDIAYLIKQGDGSFVEFEWETNYCTTFDGRFPYLTGIAQNQTIKSGSFKITALSSKSGIIEYGMTSTGFKTLFGGKTLKLQLKIRDRALHESNVIETNEFIIPQ